MSTRTDRVKALLRMKSKAKAVKGAVHRGTKLTPAQRAKIKAYILKRRSAKNSKGTTTSGGLKYSSKNSKGTTSSRGVKYSSHRSRTYNGNDITNHNPRRSRTYNGNNTRTYNGNDTTNHNVNLLGRVRDKIHDRLRSMGMGNNKSTVLATSLVYNRVVNRVKSLAKRKKNNSRIGKAYFYKRGVSI